MMTHSIKAQDTHLRQEERLGDDLAWGVAAIAEEIGRNERQTFHLLENERLPARKIGGRWCASRSGLRKHFASILNGEVV
jgi:hypothetical protein